MADFRLNTFEYYPDQPQLGICGCEHAEKQVAAGSNDKLVLGSLKDHLFERAGVHLQGNLDTCPHEILGRCCDMLEIGITQGLDGKSFKKG
jgi:hypothetical protein